MLSTKAELWRGVYVAAYLIELFKAKDWPNSHPTSINSKAESHADMVVRTIQDRTGGGNNA